MGDLILFKQRAPQPPAVTLTPEFDSTDYEKQLYECLKSIAESHMALIGAINAVTAKLDGNRITAVEQMVIRNTLVSINESLEQILSITVVE